MIDMIVMIGPFAHCLFTSLPLCPLPPCLLPIANCLLPLALLLQLTHFPVHTPHIPKQAN